MQLRFWGVRGSIASAGRDMTEVGGNTSCVEVTAGDTTLILDAGTGIRPLGQDLLRRGVQRVHLLLSHTHWDHIQGVPFFTPAYVPGTRIGFYAHRRHGLALRGILEEQMRQPYFPVTMDAMRAELSFHEMDEREELLLGGGSVRVTCRPLNHPNGVLAYRIEHAGRSVVYATDTEHYAVPDPRLVELAQDADVLIYDAQYTPQQYAGVGGPPRIGWGHSTWSEGVKVADLAGVKRLVLFHHDPAHDDAAVADIEREAGAERAGTVAAREGLTVEVRDARTLCAVPAARPSASL